MTIHCSLISKSNIMARNQDAGNELRLHSVAQLLISDNTGSIMENSVRWKLDIDKVTTDLKYNGGKLPDKATLEQVGNTVKYVSIKSPIEYAYKIFIPATVNYGWEHFLPH